MYEVNDRNLNSKHLIYSIEDNDLYKGIDICIKESNGVEKHKKK